MAVRTTACCIGLGLALVADLLLFAGSHGPYDYSSSSFEAALSLQELVKVLDRRVGASPALTRAAG